MKQTAIEWVHLKDCAAVGDYELTVERYKHNWECDGSTEAWKWFVVYGGAITAEGVADGMNEAKEKAAASLPESVDEGDVKSCDTE